MVSGLDRKNCWTIAEHRGDATPDGLQHLLSRAKWDADAVRDDLRDYVIDAFGDPDAILILDETGDVKKGVHSVGVQRQYTGTAGRIENCPSGGVSDLRRPARARPDRPRPVPATSWAEDPDRCDAAGIPSNKRGFATKPALARALIARAVAGEGPRGVGRRRRGLRRRPDAAGRDPRPRSGLCAGRGGQPARAHPGRPDPRGSAAGDAAHTGLAETLRRRRQPRTRATTPGPGSRCCAEDDTDTGGIIC